MRILIVSALVALLALGACTSKQPSQTSIDYTQLVNPFIGTDFTGNTYPGAQAPFGMVQLSPDNGLPPTSTRTALTTTSRHGLFP